MSPIVRIADPRGSTPRPLSLVAVAVGSTVLGLLLLKLSLVAPRLDAAAAEGPADQVSPTALAPEGEPGGSAPDGEPAGADAPGPSEDEPVAEAAGTVDAGVAGAPLAADDEAEVPVAEGADPVAEGAATGDQAAAASDRTPVHGRVAYFQCPNDECPRDHDLERSVWRALDRLGGCMGDGGQADVRVLVQGGSVSEVRFRERGAEGIDIGVLSRCVTAPLMRVTGSMLPDGAVVSFRFDLSRP